MFALKLEHILLGPFNRPKDAKDGENDADSLLFSPRKALMMRSITVYRPKRFGGRRSSLWKRL